MADSLRHLSWKSGRQVRLSCVKFFCGFLFLFRTSEACYIKNNLKTFLSFQDFILFFARFRRRPIDPVDQRHSAEPSQVLCGRVDARLRLPADHLLCERQGQVQTHRHRGRGGRWWRRKGRRSLQPGGRKRAPAKPEDGARRQVLIQCR